MREIRRDKSFILKKSSLLRDEVEVPGVGKVPFQLRPYQQQMVFHLILMPRFVVGEDTGCGKTIEVIGALAHLWEKNPTMRVLVVGTKSLASQWEEELRRFFREVNVFVAAGEVEKRRKVREAFLKCDRYPVLVYTYGSIARDFTDLQEWSGHLLVADEATVFKEPKTQIHQVMGHLGATASRAWALTATLLKNNLVEGYGIFRVIVPGVFPASPSTFIKSYCLTQLRLVARGRRVPQIIGYAPDQIEAYREAIEPYYLGRSKRDVASDLPKVLPPVEIPVSLSPAEWSLYRDAQAGLLQVGEKKDDGTTQTKMSALLRCQQVVNHAGLVEVADVPSSKLSVLVDLLTSGDYADQQVIVYSRFRTLIVNHIEPALRAQHVTVTRVTGGENDAQRAQARADFQEGRARVILLTSAGGEGINLQAASAIVFYDTPWSAGDYVQILGRMVRIGSAHERAVTLHLVAKPPGGSRAQKTIDDYTLQVLRGKLALFEKVLDRKVFDDPTGPVAPVDPSASMEGEIDTIFDMLRGEQGRSTHEQQ